MSKRVVTKRLSFDNEKYLVEQTREILNRVKRFDNKLYLEFVACPEDKGSCSQDEIDTHKGDYRRK